MTKRLLIASPAKGNLGPHYIKLFEAMLRGALPEWSCDYEVEANQSALTISRNILANDAVKERFDRVLFMDTDHPAAVGNVARILSHDHDEYQIVSGLYCMKRPGKPFWLGVRTKGAEVRPDGLLEADFVPTGFLSVSVAALIKMQEAHPDREVYVADHTLLPPGPRVCRDTMFELFPLGVNGPRTAAARLKRVRKAMETVIKKGPASATRAQLLESAQQVVEALTDKGTPGYLTGEDYFFSKLARDAGIKCWLDVKCIVPHIGTITYPILDAGAVATTCDPIPEAEGDQTTW